jgi:hypothetical protein
MNDERLSMAGDPVALANLENKLQVIRDMVTGVAKGYKHGLFLYGGGGMGKSYAVVEQLRRLEAPYQLHNSRMTGKGLFLALKQAPDAIHLLEDMERLTKDADAQGVLRSAMWAQPGHERIVTWTTAKDGLESFVFRGGLILISNRPLANLPELRALATRIDVLHFEATDAEQTARMYALANRGYHQRDKMVIGATECLEITEHLLNECRAAGCPLDRRLQQKSFQTYLQWDADLTALQWKDLISASVREAAHHFRYESNPMSQEAKRKRKRNVIRELTRQFPDDVKEQEQHYVDDNVGSRADFYRRKREVECGEFDEADAT